METDQDDLETGYGRHAPPGDNLCNDYAQGLADAYGALASARGDRIDDSYDMLLADRASPSLFGNVAVVRRPLETREWPDAVARMGLFFGGRQGGSFLVFSAWPTPDLTAYDFGRIGHPPLMLRQPGPPPATAIEGFHIRAVEDNAGAADWERVVVDGFPLTELKPVQRGCLLPAAALGVGGWRHWVGYLDGHPVATASAFVAPGHLDVEFVSTLDAARGRGIGRAITAMALSPSTDLPALLITSDLGRPVYERLGFRSILRYTLWAGHRLR